jgi:hypothetical protein
MPSNLGQSEYVRHGTIDDELPYFHIKGFRSQEHLLSQPFHFAMSTSVGRRGSDVQFGAFMRILPLRKYTRIAKLEYLFVFYYCLVTILSDERRCDNE